MIHNHKLTWKRTRYSYVAEAGEGLIRLSITYSLITGEAYLASVNGQRIAGDFDDPGLAKTAAETAAYKRLKLALEKFEA